MPFAKKISVSFLFLDKQKYTFPLLLFLLALALRLPLYHTPFWRTPDGIEYINVARNLIAGKGLTQSIKFEFFDHYPVVSLATFRPPLTYLLFAGLLLLHNDVYFLQVFILVLGAVNIVLLYLLMRTLTSSVWSLLFSLIAALNPNLLINNRLVLTEQIFYFFVLLILLLFYTQKKTHRTYGYMGFFLGLAFLTRPETILVLGVLIIFSLKNKRELALMLGIVFITILPYYIFLIFHGYNFLHSSYGYYFRVRHISEGWMNGFNLQYPTAVGFMSHNFVWIVQQVGKNIFEGIKSLLSFGFLGPLTLIFFLLSRKGLSKIAPLFTLAVLSFLLLSATWSIFLEPERHLGLVFLLMLVIFASIDYAEKKKVAVLVLIVITLFITLPVDIHRVVWARTQESHQDFWDPSRKQSFYTWVREHTPSSAIIATDNPSLVTLFTNRATIFLPASVLSADTYQTYISEYKVNYVVVTNEQQKRFLQTVAKQIEASDGLSVFTVK